jgi:hypothetical protein
VCGDRSSTGVHGGEAAMNWKITGEIRCISDVEISAFFYIALFGPEKWGIAQ